MKLLDKCRNFVKEHSWERISGKVSDIRIENITSDLYTFVLNDRLSQTRQELLKESRSGYSRVVGQEMPSGEVTVAASTEDKEEPAYKELPFSMEEYKKHPDCLYLRETGAQIKELIHFNTARYSFQYAGTVNGDLHLFISGNEFILRVPVKRVRKQGWVNVYDDTPGNILECWADGVFQTKEEALNHMLVGIKCPKQVKIEWAEEE